MLGPSSARATWGLAVSLVAAAYHEQVQLDYECFADYYRQTFGTPTDALARDGNADLAARLVGARRRRAAESSVEINQ